MSQPNKLDDLRDELTRQRVPQNYIARVMRELQDHHEDLVNDSEDTNLLGGTEALTDTIVSEYRGRSLAARRPWLIYLVLPIPLLMLIWHLFCVGMVLLMIVLFPDRDWSEVDRIPAVWVQRAVEVSAMCIPFALSMLWTYRWTVRSERGRKWFLLSCGLQAFAAWMLILEVILPQAQTPGCICLRFGTDTHDGLFAISRVVQVVVILGCGAFFCRRLARHQHSAPA